MDSEAEDRVSRLESELSKAREQARVQQNTLDHILNLLQRLPIPGTPQAPQDPSPAPPAPMVTASAAPAVREPSRGLKPATPNDFDGDRLKGRAFLNSCRLYISLCESQFRDDQAMIHWALSFMKSGRAALYANRILRRETSEALPAFVSWKGFELDFISKFCPKNEATVALTKLESTRYYQGRKSVDDYIDKFSELVKEAGYSDGLSIVMKFRKGLDWDIQDRIAEMVQGRPEDDDPEEWYAAARVLDANRAANQAFHSTQRVVALTPGFRAPLPAPRAQPPTNSASPASRFPTSQYPGVPARASNIPTPMEIDAARCKNPTPMLCRRCGEPGHFARECPKGYDVRYMTSDERQDWIEHLLSEADIRVAQAPTPESETVESLLEEVGQVEEDFTSRSG
jgi:Retrotransposon gag protein/Zinc knuckle